MQTVNRWEKELQMLKNIIRKTPLTETIKWGVETYTYKGKKVLGILGFKNHFTLWFYNGVFLKDPLQKLINAQEGKTRALRQWRFSSEEEIIEEEILTYISEAIKNEEEGRVWQPETSEQMKIPQAFMALFKTQPEVKQAFDNLTKYKRKEFIEYIEEAKRETTKQTRLQKIIPMILNGTGLNDKYKKK